MGRFRLLSAPFSYYSAKTRTNLRLKGLAFDERLATLWVYRRVIVPKTGVRFIPVLLTPQGQALQDSSVIMDWLEAEHPTPALVPDPGRHPTKRLAAELLELFTDNWMLVPAMHARWNDSSHLDEVHANFGSIVSPWLPKPLRRLAGSRLSRFFADGAKALGASESTAEALVAFQTDTRAVLESHFERWPFAFGQRASSADVALAGPVAGHWAVDPNPSRELEKYPAITAWLKRIKDRVEGPSDAEPDEIPVSLDPLFRRFFEEYAPLLVDAHQRLAEYAQNPSRPEGRVPRALGRHAFRVGGAQGERAVLTHPLWMLQRVLDVHRTVEWDSRVQAWLIRVGGEAQMRSLRDSAVTRLERRRNRLFLASR
ncbi:MAG: glutathione S-transferase family protein [Myxococcota bacterium]